MNPEDAMSAMVEDVFKQAFELGQKHPTGELVACVATWTFDAGTFTTTPSVSWLVKEPDTD